VTSFFRADRRWQQVRKLTEVGRALTSAVSLDEVLRLAIERTTEFFAAQKAVLLLTNDDGLLSVRASFGLDPASCERFREPLHETLITRLQTLLGRPPAEHFLGVPLVIGGAVTGLLAVTRTPATSEPEDEEWLLSALADQAAVALEKTLLNEAAEFRERLIGIVSHDLRDPISAIAMATDVLLHRGGLDERTTRTIVRIQSSAERAARLIAALLDFTQARLGGGIPVERRPMDLHVVVRQVIEELELNHPGRTIQVTEHGDGAGEWDPDRIAQVVGNLIANALRYSPEASVVRVRLEGTAETIVISVHNEGPPIPAERLPHVFEPLRRAASAMTTTPTRSVGLGLYIVKHIVEAHRGTVSVDSSEESGTTLTVILPRCVERARISPTEPRRPHG